MEVYPLDPLLRRIDIVEGYESLIWTERYKQYGDFELSIPSTQRSRSLLKPDTLLAMSESHRVMRVESFEDGVDSEGRHMLLVKGRSIEAMLQDRVARNELAPTQVTTGTGEDAETTDKVWTLTGTPAVIMRKIFHDICVTGILSVHDKIPLINEGSTFLPATTITEPVDPITVDLDPVTVYDALIQIADIWNLGFRLIREYDTSKLWFDVYTGTDRTSGQAVRPAVIFAPELDNLQNTKELTITQDTKNVAYVYSPIGYQTVYADGVDPEIDGFDRKVLVVSATDVTADKYTTPEEIAAALARIGSDELVKYRVSQAFDGEINQHSAYQYGRDYFLGDNVEQRNSSGVANVMQVTEQIFVSDQEGERSYPTLTKAQFINTGSWLSWLNNKQWSELTTEEWEDQP